MRLGLRARRRDGTIKDRAAIVRKQLGARSVVLIGMMGAGKSAVGRRLASKLQLPFIDADTEIETAAGKTITEIFADHGEAYFREGERKVIARLLKDGPLVLATGGGAYMDPRTRQIIRDHGISVWLKADLGVLINRVHRRDDRPLLMTGDRKAVMQELMTKRYPVYAKADITVPSRDVPHEVIVGEIIAALYKCPLIAPPRGGKRQGR